MSTPSHPDALIGQVVDGRYRIRGVLGRGGMGVVYEAEAIRLGKRRCAIKVLLPEFTRNPTVVARFAREAEVAARVKHPNVVEIFDTGQTAAGLGYIAMELLLGEPLDRLLKREGPLPWPRAQKLLIQICRALAAAHAHGVIHRDIKPENCFRTTVDGDDDFIKVLDFGIAKLTEVEDGANLTATNSMIGTYAYMSYEQVCGEPADHRVDIWATGVILYEMLTGRQPFRGANQGQIWKAIANYDPEPMHDIADGVPVGADEVVQRALAKDRDDRFPTADALARAIASVSVDGAPVTSITRKLAALDPPTDIDASAETALGSLASHPSVTAAAHDLTELVPADLKPVTRETALHVVSASTHPGRDEPPPSREAMQTEVAPIPSSSAILPPSPTSPRRLVVLVPLVLLLTAAALLLIKRPPDRTPERPIAAVAPEQPDPPAPQPVEPPPATPASPEPEPIPAAQPEPAPTSAKPKPAESFAAKVAAKLKTIRDSSDTRSCFQTFQPKEPLELGIELTTSGALTVTYPKLKRGSPITRCLDQVFAKTSFPKGKPGDATYKKSITFNR